MTDHKRVGQRIHEPRRKGCFGWKADISGPLDVGTFHFGANEGDRSKNESHNLNPEQNR